jgi:hypothetical protein
MKKSSLDEEQIAHVLRQAEAGVQVQELIRYIGVTEQTFSTQRMPAGTEDLVEWASSNCVGYINSEMRTASLNSWSLTSPWT